MKVISPRPRSRVGRPDWRSASASGEANLAPTFRACPEHREWGRHLCRAVSSYSPQSAWDWPLLAPVRRCPCDITSVSFVFVFTKALGPLFIFSTFCVGASALFLRDRVTRPPPISGQVLDASTKCRGGAAESRAVGKAAGPESEPCATLAPSAESRIPCPVSRPRT